VESVLEGELDGVGYPKIETAESSAGETKENEKVPEPSESGYRTNRSY
jgi:hypothetical protein